MKFLLEMTLIALLVFAVYKAIILTFFPKKKESEVKVKDLESISASSEKVAEEKKEILDSLEEIENKTKQIKNNIS